MINRAQLTGPLGWSLAAIIVTAIVVLIQVPPLLVALVTPGAPEDDAVTNRISEVVKASQTMHAAYKDRFNGRYLFFPPLPPPPPRPEFVGGPPGPPPPPTPKIEDTSYSGPLQVAFPWSDVVWFKDQAGQLVKLAPGQEHDGVTLVSIDPPWSVRVRWHSKEWDLEQFKDFKKASDLISTAGETSAQPAAQVPGFTVVPQERTDSAATVEPVKEEPRTPQQSESSPQPVREALPSSPAAPAASVEPSSGALSDRVDGQDVNPSGDRTMSGSLPYSNQIPDAYAADQIQALNREESRQRLSVLSKAIQIGSITPEEKKRLLDEWKQVRDHLRDLPRDEQ